ncbi:hypothetical protein BTUL_0153g00210 [Botrytis tulipae]|uniref:Uncharacterized protein n=1 Tax=Botrytis tulipae TaxID=87230 RepID=A0A4Z1EC74_9HELO|nr:hypothetical protein BTUL_0153g00210 [Botrytis tulipae]
MIELSRRKPADESIDYQALEDVTFNPELRSTPVAVDSNKNSFVPSSLSDKSLTDGDDISYNQRKSTQISRPPFATWGIHWKKPSLLGLASIAPAATLTIVAKNISEEVRLPVLDFSKASWNNSVDGQYNAVSITNTIAINTASNINVLGLSRQVSGSEWSYTLQFYGPSIKCNEPNNTQQAIFNNITKYYEQNNVFTYDDQNDNFTNTTFGVGSGKIVYTSWSTWYA